MPEYASAAYSVLMRMRSVFAKARLSAFVAAFLAAIAGMPCRAQAGGLEDGIRAIVERSSSPVLDGRRLDLVSLRAFYGRRAFAPAWTGSAAATRDAQILIATISTADQEGLEPARYHADDSLLRLEPDDPERAVERDVLLTDGALRYAAELRSGRSDLRDIDRDVDLPFEAFDPVAALDSALRGDTLSAFLAELPPPHPEYEALKIALARYRSIADDGGWPMLPAVPAAKFAETDQMRALLRQRLALEYADLAPSQTGNLVEAIERFQSRHGLKADGRVGKATLKALNVPAADRALQIAANMERWRWLPRNFEADYIVINVPAAELSVVANGTTVLSSRVIVGRPRDPTPLLRAVAGAVTINPAWNVPPPIARKEILPRLKANPGYLESQDMILIDGPAGDPYGLHVPWRTISRNAFPYRIQQRPGPKNALGRIKIELPNRFEVYLHDTPGQSAFALNERYLSHGCVRVESILPLASYALTRDPNAAVPELEAAVASEITQEWPLNAPLPIYFLYWTAFADAHGILEFRNDIYGRDGRLVAASKTAVAGQQVTAIATGCRSA